MFIKIEYYELWNIVMKGPCIPKTIIDGKLVEKMKINTLKKMLRDF